MRPVWYLSLLRNGIPAEGKGQTAEEHRFPGPVFWDVWSTSCVLSHYVERCHSRYRLLLCYVTVNVGVFQDSRFFVCWHRKYDLWCGF